MVLGILELSCTLGLIVLGYTSHEANVKCQSFKRR